MNVINRNQNNIGKLLFEAGKLNAAQVEAITTLHQQEGLLFGEAAKKLGYVTDDDINQVLSKQFSYSYLTPGEHSLSPELVSAYQPFSKQVEIFRALRSQLLLRWFDGGNKILSINHLARGAGATYVTANLGVVFSQLGKRTLLVDVDMRNPKLSSMFDSRSKMGVSDILASRAGFEAVSKVPQLNNLSLLPAGTLPPNPQELLSKPIFIDMLNSVAEHFDVILLDTPAHAVAADALIVAARSGGNLVVVRNNKTSLADLKEMALQLSTNAANTVGTVLNDF